MKAIFFLFAIAFASNLGAQSCGGQTFSKGVEIQLADTCTVGGNCSQRAQNDAQLIKDALLKFLDKAANDSCVNYLCPNPQECKADRLAFESFTTSCLDGDKCKVQYLKRYECGCNSNWASLLLNDSTLHCGNDSITLTVQTNVSSPTYQWFANDTTPISGATDSFLVVDTAGAYFVLVYDSSNFQIDSTVTIIASNQVEVTGLVFDTLILSTGWDMVNGILLSPSSNDGRWKNTMRANTPISPTDVFVINPSPFWGQAPAGSQWVGHSPNSTAVAPSGEYRYQTQFEIAAVDPSLELRLGCMGDDSISMYFNGYPLVLNQREYVNPIYIQVSGPTYFVQGTNVIEVHIKNDDPPHGFVVDAVLAGCQEAITASEPILNSSYPFKDVALHPNPSTDMIHISGTPTNIRIVYTVVDMWGRKLIESNSSNIAVRTLPSGIYFVRMDSKLGTYSIRFVKN